MTMLNDPKSAPTTPSSAAPAVAKARYKGKTGARILHEMLIGTHKVDTMFGYPGGAILPVFDELYRHPRSSF
jgi:acetolactate synthase-1/2/3 large subunit